MSDNYYPSRIIYISILISIYPNSPIWASQVRWNIWQDLRIASYENQFHSQYFIAAHFFQFWFKIKTDLLRRPSLITDFCCLERRVINTCEEILLRLSAEDELEKALLNLADTLKLFLIIFFLRLLGRCYMSCSLTIEPQCRHVNICNYLWWTKIIIYTFIFIDLYILLLIAAGKNIDYGLQNQPCSLLWCHNNHQ